MDLKEQIQKLAEQEFELRQTGICAKICCSPEQMELEHEISELVNQNKKEGTKSTRWPLTNKKE